MPILQLEPYVLPDDLFSQPSPRFGESARWWVLHTRPRAEKSLARAFCRRHIPFFLPLGQRRRRWKGRILTSHVPLFPGYVFLLGDERARYEGLCTHLVAHCLPVANQEQLHVDLEAVHQLMNSGVPLAPEEQLRPGTPVEIISGPLEGLQGKVLRQGRRLKFIVEVHFLQRGASVEIDSWMIQPLNI